MGKIGAIGLPKPSLLNVDVLPQNACFYKKAQLLNKCIIVRRSNADSWIRINDDIAKVMDIYTIGPENDLYVVCKNCSELKNLFTSVIESSRIGINKFSGLNDYIEVVKVNKTCLKCNVLPYKHYFVAFNFVHSLY